MELIARAGERWETERWRQAPSYRAHPRLYSAQSSRRRQAGRAQIGAERFQRPYLALILVIVPSALSLLREAFALLKFSDAVFGNAATIGRDRAG
jgi:hypothetical protein